MGNVSILTSAMDKLQNIDRVCRSSCQDVFYENTVLENFKKFKDKHLKRSLLFSKFFHDYYCKPKQPRMASRFPDSYSLFQPSYCDLYPVPLEIIQGLICFYMVSCGIICCEFSIFVDDGNKMPKATRTKICFFNS